MQYDVCISFFKSKYSPNNQYPIFQLECENVKTPTAGLHWVVNREDVYFEAFHGLKCQDDELHHNLMIKKYTGDHQNVMALYAFRKKIVIFQSSYADKISAGLLPIL